MYLRFTGLRRLPDSPRSEGIFCLAYRLLRGDDLDRPLHAWLAEEVDWFDEHLDAPRHGVREQALFWFRAEARIVVSRAFSLSAALRAAGERLRVVRTERPGSIVWRDSHQVAAIPWRDTFAQAHAEGRR